MAPDRIAPEPALSDVVRQRLAALLDEVPARHAVPSVGGDDFEPSERAARPARQQLQSDAARWRHVSGPGWQREAASDWESAEASPVPRPRASRSARSPGWESAGETGENRRRRVIGRGAGQAREGETVAGAERLPARWARAAWQFSREHLVAVGVVLLTGCLWAGYNVLQVSSSPVPAVAAPSVVASPVAIAVPTPVATSAPPQILVHVIGAVRKPGVVSLPQGARVQDALAAAGGLTASANPAELNLAASVADGSQLIIGDKKQPKGEVRGTAAAGGAPGAGSAPLSLNSASAAELEELPGVGPVTAGRIVAWRTEHGRFTSVDELQEVDGIGPKTYAHLADLVRL